MTYKRSSTTDAGFGAITLIMGMLVLGAIVGSGYTIVSKQRIKQNTANATDMVQPSTLSTAASPESTLAKSTETKTELIIKEWGVTISLPENAKDTYYVTGTSSIGTDNKPSAIYVGTKALDTDGCIAADGNKGKPPLAMIVRVGVNDIDPVKGTKYTVQYPNGITIDQHYYAYISWTKAQGQCDSKPKLEALDEMLKSAIKTTKKSAISNSSAIE